MRKTFFPVLFDEGDFTLDFPSNTGLSLFEKENKVFVEANLAGLDSSDIDIHLDDNLLTIKGEKKEETKDKEVKYYKKSHRSYSYHLSLPKNIDPSVEPHAKFEKGILTVEFKKKNSEPPKGKKIPIK